MSQNVICAVDQQRVVDEGHDDDRNVENLAVEYVFVAQFLISGI
jgi:hypothetical protein